MRKITIHTLLVFGSASMIYAQAGDEDNALIDSVEVDQPVCALAADTAVHMFSDHLLATPDSDLYRHIESSLQAMIAGKADTADSRVELTAGTVKDLKKISAATDCRVSKREAKEILVEWVVDGSTVAVKMPVGYDASSNRSRSEIEDDFVNEIRRSKGKWDVSLPAMESLEAYMDSLYVLPGETYRKRNINRNRYYTAVDTITPVWDADYPLESMANLFVCALPDKAEVQVNLSVSKHEYGEKEQMEVSLSRLLDAMQKSGCKPFWGIEKYADGKMEGVLFMRNVGRGYDHMVRITCNPADIIDGTGVIEAGAALFIPTNNIADDGQSN